MVGLAMTLAPTIPAPPPAEEWGYLESPERLKPTHNQLAITNSPQIQLAALDSDCRIPYGERLHFNCPSCEAAGHVPGNSTYDVSK